MCGKHIAARRATSPKTLHNTIPSPYRLTPAPPAPPAPHPTPHPTASPHRLTPALHSPHQHPSHLSPSYLHQHPSQPPLACICRERGSPPRGSHVASSVLESPPASAVLSSLGVGEGLHDVIFSSCARHRQVAMSLTELLLATLDSRDCV